MPAFYFPKIPPCYIINLSMSRIKNNIYVKIGQRLTDHGKRSGGYYDFVSCARGACARAHRGVCVAYGIRHGAGDAGVSDAFAFGLARAGFVLRVCSHSARRVSVSSASFKNKTGNFRAAPCRDSLAAFDVYFQPVAALPFASRRARARL